MSIFWQDLPLLPFFSCFVLASLKARKLAADNATAVYVEPLLSCQPGAKAALLLRYQTGVRVHSGQQHSSLSLICFCFFVEWIQNRKIKLLCNFVIFNYCLYLKFVGIQRGKNWIVYFFTLGQVQVVGLFFISKNILNHRKLHTIKCHRSRRHARK